MRANALQAQIDELNTALAGANAEADRLKERVEALSADVVRAERQAAGAEARAGRAEAATAGERSRADVLRDRVDGLQQDLLASQAVASELMAGRALMMVCTPASSLLPSTTPWRHSRRLRSYARPI